MRFLRVGLAGAILASLLVSRVVLAAAPHVAVVEASSSKLPRGEAAKLRADVEAVLRSLGAETIPSADAKAAAKGDCNQTDCMLDIGRATGATHILRVESSFKKGAFTIQLQMWDGRTGKALSSDGKSCDICTLPDLHEAIRDQVKGLCTRVFEAETAAIAPPPPPVLAPAPPPPPPAVEVSTPAPAPAPAEPAGNRLGQVGGLSLVALGVAAVAYGGYLLHLNGKTVCANNENTNCAHFHATAGRGAGFLVGGMGALLAGGYLFYTFTW
jgi:hypothetical protein